MEEIFQKIPKTSEQVLLHLCRHFENLPPEDTTKLMDLGINRSEIEDELKLVGSKFYDPPFKGVYSLLDYIEKNWYTKHLISFEKDILITRLTLNRNEFPKGIGNDGLVSLNSLNELEQSKVYKKERKPYIVNSYPTSNKFPTWEFIVISKTAPSVELITIYPGTFAPPFPTESMTPEFFKECDEFWNAHALIESN